MEIEVVCLLLVRRRQDGSRIQPTQTTCPKRTPEANGFCTCKPTLCGSETLSRGKLTGIVWHSSAPGDNCVQNWLSFQASGLLESQFNDVLRISDEFEVLTVMEDAERFVGMELDP